MSLKLLKVSLYNTGNSGINTIHFLFSQVYFSYEFNNSVDRFCKVPANLWEKTAKKWEGRNVLHPSLN